MEHDMTFEIDVRKIFSASSRRAALRALALSAGALCIATGLQAQEWPNSPIKLIIPFAPGGGNDGAGRLLAKALEDRFKVPVVVENKAGANGTIAMNFLRQSKPDGYTLSLVSTGALDVNPWMMNLPYDPAKDFTYLGTIVKFPLYLAVLPSSGIKSVSDLVAKARAEPGKITYSSAGIGNSIHLAGALLAHNDGHADDPCALQGRRPRRHGLAGWGGDFYIRLGSFHLLFCRFRTRGVVGGLRQHTGSGSWPDPHRRGSWGQGFRIRVLGRCGGPGRLANRHRQQTQQRHQRTSSIRLRCSKKSMPWACCRFPPRPSNTKHMVTKDREKYGALIKAANIRAE